jgi:hypothetical protein
MEHHPNDPLARWLAAEGSGIPDSDSEAEEALSLLLAALERPAPPAGFAERVLLRAAAEGALPAAAAAPLPAGLRNGFQAWVRTPWGRAALVLLLVAAALGLTFAFGLLQPLLGWVAPGNLVAVLVEAVGALGTALAAALAAVQKVEILRRALALSLGSPAVAGTLGLCLALSVLAFRLVHDTLQRERSWSYVDSI